MGWAEAYRVWLCSTLCAVELEAIQHITLVLEGKMVGPEGLAAVVVVVEPVVVVALAERWH